MGTSEDDMTTFACVYCGTEMPSGEQPTSWPHCGEAGHVEEVVPCRHQWAHTPWGGVACVHCGEEGEA
jgi:hypothetical protein